MTAIANPSPSLLPGFSDPVHEAQQNFRALLDAMARPGSIRTLPPPTGVPAGWSSGLTALALTLFDQDTTIWLDPAAASTAALAHLRFHCGCRIADAPSRAAFAVITNTAHAPPLHTFPIGDPQYPERSTTLILAIESLTGGAPQRWTGPGIQGSATVAPKGLPPNFVAQWADNHALYPSGVDVFLIAGDQVMGLPRGVSIEEI
jgi:alpha-D-ribose 1-methylphosphonate 5-triphosphate synthase subunit PhnH